MAKRRMDPVDALKLAIERERGANKFYLQAAAVTGDPQGQGLFTWLAKQELRHLAKLRKQLKSVLDAGQWVQWRTVTAPIERGELPSVSEAGGEVSVSAGEREALRLGIEAEREAVAFYRAAGESTPDPHGKAMFGSLAAEEEGHLALLEEELEWITKSRQYFTLHRFRPGGY